MTWLAVWSLGPLPAVGSFHGSRSPQCGATPVPGRTGSNVAIPLPVSQSDGGGEIGAWCRVIGGTKQARPVLDEAATDGGGGQLNAGVRAEFAEEVGDVSLHGAGADTQRAGDFAVMLPGDEEREDISFAWAES